MTAGPTGAVLRDIQTLFDTGTASGLSDRQLLERFVGRRDGSAEAAFEVLIQRHGPMVLRVCHNVLGNASEAEDAFQATFLILVKRSGSIRRLESLGSWLYGVACRVAARARVEAARRRAVERKGALRVVSAVAPSVGSQVDFAEFGPIIQEEVQRLPERHRAVVVLCYWQGLTHEQAALQLGCPLGTVRSRLARARGRLHRRLVRRGFVPLAGVVAAMFDSGSTQAARIGVVSNVLVSSTVKTGMQVATGHAMTDVASAAAAGVAQQVLRSMFMLKLRLIAVSLIFIGLGIYGASLAAPQASSPRPVHKPSNRAAATAKESKSKAQPGLVDMGDYVVEPPDLLIVEVLEALPGRPISGERLVRPDGKISLGFYGEVYVAGLTLTKVKAKIVEHLQQYLSDDVLGLVYTDESNEPIIDPKTKKPKTIIPQCSSNVFVDVSAYNSKNYYIQGEVFVPGRLPVTGRETILDAITFAGGLTPRADHKTVILYRQISGEPLQALPIDIDQITMGDDLSTNYQMMPGDRLVIHRDPDSKAEVRDTEARVADRESAHLPDAHRFFDRQTTTSGTRAAQVLNGREDGDDRGALLRLEQRLSDVERKLDVLIDAFKRQAR